MKNTNQITNAHQEAVDSYNKLKMNKATREFVESIENSKPMKVSEEVKNLTMVYSEEQDRLLTRDEVEKLVSEAVKKSQNNLPVVHVKNFDNRENGYIDTVVMEMRGDELNAVLRVYKYILAEVEEETAILQELTTLLRKTQSDYEDIQKLPTKNGSSCAFGDCDGADLLEEGFELAIEHHSDQVTVKQEEQREIDYYIEQIAEHASWRKLKTYKVCFDRHAFDLIKENVFDACEYYNENYDKLDDVGIEVYSLNSLFKRLHTDQKKITEVVKMAPEDMPF